MANRINPYTYLMNQELLLYILYSTPVARSEINSRVLQWTSDVCQWPRVGEWALLTWKTRGLPVAQSGLLAFSVLEFRVKGQANTKVSCISLSNTLFFHGDLYNSDVLSVGGVPGSLGTEIIS